MTAPGFTHLPDFSRGESSRPPRGRDFEPLFGESNEDQIWVDETKIQPAATTADTAAAAAADTTSAELVQSSAMDDPLDDLAQLASELDQLQSVEPAQIIEAEPTQQTQSTQPTQPAPSDAQVDADELQQLRDQHAEELQRLSALHNEEVLQQLQNLQSGLVEQVGDRLELILAQSLQQLLQDRLAGESIDQLVGEIVKNIRRDGIDRIKLSGPEALTTAVTEALADHGDCQIDVQQCDSTDIVVQLNEQILSTRISDWTRKIEKALV
ncbi:MAG: hypothetical protein ABJM29_17035 [Rhizobiaceae bacterium]